MAKKTKTYIAKIKIVVGDRKYKRGSVVSSHNIKKETFKNLIEKGYIKESDLGIKEDFQGVKVSVNEVNEKLTENDPDDEEDDEDHEDTDESTEEGPVDGLEIDGDDILG